jgi:hypothetical protein
MQVDLKIWHDSDDASGGALYDTVGTFLKQLSEQAKRMENQDKRASPLYLLNRSAQLLATYGLQGELHERQVRYSTLTVHLRHHLLRCTRASSIQLPAVIRNYALISAYCLTAQN